MNSKFKSQITLYTSKAWGRRYVHVWCVSGSIPLLLCLQVQTFQLFPSLIQSLGECEPSYWCLSWYPPSWSQIFGTYCGLHACLSLRVVMIGFLISSSFLALCSFLTLSSNSILASLSFAFISVVFLLVAKLPCCVWALCWSLWSVVWSCQGSSWRLGSFLGQNFFSLLVWSS